MATELELENVVKFLAAIGHPVKDQWFEIRLIAQDGFVGSKWYRQNEDVAADLENLVKSGANVYFGINPRSVQLRKKEMIKTIICLWVDIDPKNFGEGGKEGALARLRKFRLAPTAIVDSGNGLHAYWRLKEPVSITGQTDIDRIEGVLRGLIREINADPACCNLDRILRLPGTMNVKDAGDHKPCLVIEINSERQYGLNEFVILNQTYSETTTSQPSIAQRPDVSSLLTMEQGDRHTNLLRMVGKLIGGGMTDLEVFTLLEPFADKAGTPASELRRLCLDIGLKQQNKLAGLPKQDFLGSLAATLKTSSPTESGEGSLQAVSKRISFNEFITATPPPIDWRVENLFTAVGVNFLAGQGGLGKSWLSMDLALAVATGAPWLGHHATTTCPILYCDFENSNALIQRRFAKLLKARNLEPSIIKNFDFYRPDSLLLDRTDGGIDLDKQISEQKAGLVILDSFTRIHTGDENAVKDMAKVSATLLYLTQKHQCCILVIDHLGKQSNGLRGSTEKRAMPETIVEIEEHETDVMRLTVTKLRATGDIPKPFLVERKDIGHDATMIRRIEECADITAQNDPDLDWLTNYLDQQGGEMPNPRLERELQTVRGWGQKKVANVLERGRIANRMFISSERNPETKRFQGIVQLVKRQSDLIPPEATMS